MSDSQDNRKRKLAALKARREQSIAANAALANQEEESKRAPPSPAKEHLPAPDELYAASVFGGFAGDGVGSGDMDQHGRAAAAPLVIGWGTGDLPPSSGGSSPAPRSFVPGPARPPHQQHQQHQQQHQQQQQQQHSIYQNLGNNSLTGAPPMLGQPPRGPRVGGRHGTSGHYGPPPNGPPPHGTPNGPWRGVAAGPGGPPRPSLPSPPGHFLPGDPRGGHPPPPPHLFVPPPPPPPPRQGFPGMAGGQGFPGAGGQWVGSGGGGAYPQQSSPQSSRFAPTGSQPMGGGRGGRGRGGRGENRSGRGEVGAGSYRDDGRGARGGEGGGFYKPSFVEDPWRDLLQRGPPRAFA